MGDRAERNARIRQLAALGWSKARIAREVGCGKDTPARVLRLPQLACDYCGVTFEATKRDARYCSKPHYDAARYASDPEAVRTRVGAWKAGHPERVSANVRAARARWQAETLDQAGNHWKRWTGPELEIILREDLTVRQAAIMLGRTYAAVARMRQLARQDPRKDWLAGLPRKRAA